MHPSPTYKLTLYLQLNKLTCTVPEAVGVDGAISEVWASFLLGEALRLRCDILTRAAAAPLMVDIGHVLEPSVAQCVVHYIKHHSAGPTGLLLTGNAGSVATGVIEFVARFLFYWRPEELGFLELVVRELHWTVGTARKWHRLCHLTVDVQLLYLCHHVWEGRE